MTPLTDSPTLSADVFDDQHFSASPENDDFFVMDGLEIEDDFCGLLDINANVSFKDDDEDSVVSQTSKRASESDTDTLMPESPPVKKSRSNEPNSPMSVTSIASIPGQSSTPPIKDLKEEYQMGLQHLALSMRRSEMTRSEILRQRQLGEIKAKISVAQMHSISNADTFLQGEQSTLTSGLAHSRRMLRAYMGKMKSQL